MVHHSGTEHTHLSWIGKNSHFYPKKQKKLTFVKVPLTLLFFLFFKRNSFCQNKISKLNFRGVKIWPKKTFLKPKILFLGIENDLFFPFFLAGWALTKELAPLPYFEKCQSSFYHFPKDKVEKYNISHL